ncbi:MAG: hypothetical protein ACTTJL_03600 [Hoylesella enoeca]|uniref:hypothetical protein n=1 Tax=Hoylesella enoeca TaxID=76123 RepID=UPI003F9ECDE1
MNKQQHSVKEFAAQCLPNGHPYIIPWCRIIPLESENFICVSVELDVQDSEEEEWEEDEEVSPGWQDRLDKW